MNQILICIPFCKADSEACERLLDWIFELNGRKSNGYCLLAAANDVHPEVREKIKVSASLAFDHYDMIACGPNTSDKKNEQINFMFRSVAQFVGQSYRLPFYWMESDTTPLARDWIKQLAASYWSQPKRYCGSVMKQGSTFAPFRGIIYPADCHNELAPFCNNTGVYNHNAAHIIMPRLTKTRVVAEINIASPADYAKVPQHAALVHSDKRAFALDARESELNSKKAAGSVLQGVEA